LRNRDRRASSSVGTTSLRPEFAILEERARANGLTISEWIPRPCEQFEKEKWTKKATCFKE
jgi:hypothetical protein